MAKGKSANPVDAFRKQQRAKEKKKNQDERKKTRENQTIKKDTRDLEREIRELKQGKQDASSKTRLESLETELAKIKKIKDKYLEAHPEHRHIVYKEGTKKKGGPSGDGSDDEGEGKSGLGGPAHLYDASGKLRDPTRSVYYHEVYNPFGVPPPGMPYRERTPDSDSSEEDSEDEDDDDEIVMPEGPPPEDEVSEDSDDDIPLPEGPPPSNLPPPPPPPQHNLPVRPNLPPTFPPNLPPNLPPGPPPDIGWGAHYQAGVPILPPNQARPPRPPLHTLPFHPANQRPPMHFGQPGPGPGSGSGSGGAPYRPNMTPNGQSYRPPGFRPQNRAPTAVQDPLSDKPTETYQGHRMMKHELPPRPSTDTSTITATATTSSEAGPSKTTTTTAKPPPEAATISAAPQLRDLRKEATVFAPRAVGKRKRRVGPAAAALGSGGVNAAPGGGDVDDEGDEVRKRVQEGPGLLGKLQGVLGVPSMASRGGGGGGAGNGGQDDDYQKFLEGLGDIS